MNNKYFPNSPQDLSYVMRIYEDEILTRKDWINESVEKMNNALNDSNSPTSIIILYAMSIINHAMVIVRILDKNGTSSRKREKERSKERARILHERNPGLPKPPKMLRDIRNDYEHFEEKIDQWATTSKTMSYVDLIVFKGGPLAISGVNEQDIFRRLEGNNLTFWNNKVNLQEVIDWVEEISEIVSENNRHRF